MKKLLGVFLAFTLLVVLIPHGVLAQGGVQSADALANQHLRGYTHMFIAYFIAWALILGWVISIARRLGRIEKALKE